MSWKLNVLKGTRCVHFVHAAKSVQGVTVQVLVLGIRALLTPTGANIKPVVCIWPWNVEWNSVKWLRAKTFNTFHRSETPNAGSPAPVCSDMQALKPMRLTWCNSCLLDSVVPSSFNLSTASNVTSTMAAELDTWDLNRWHVLSLSFICPEAFFAAFVKVSFAMWLTWSFRRAQIFCARSFQQQAPALST